MPTARPAEPGERLTLCVVWTARGVTLPQDLARALAAKPLRTVHPPDPYAAMAELCAALRPSPGAAGSARGGVALLLVEPRDTPAAAALVVATERYTPRAVVWAYEAASPARLRAVSHADIDRWTGRSSPLTETPLSPSVSPRIRPALRLTEPAQRREPLAAGDPAPVSNGGGRGDVTDEGRPPDVQVTRGIRHVLSKEELAMLLDEGPEPRRSA